jgi:putative membrane protein
MPMGRYIAQAAGLYGYGWLFEIVILILLFLIFYWIINSMHKKESAMDILKRRYASGELSSKEYSSLKKDITEEKK